jgi:hypothetical protein
MRLFCHHLTDVHDVYQLRVRNVMRFDVHQENICDVKAYCVGLQGKT